MKHKTYRLFYLFRPRGLIIVALLLCNAIATAQEQTPPTGEFPIGSSLSGIPWRRTQWEYYTSFGSSGMNTIIQYANDVTKDSLDRYNLLAYNMDLNDWIMYYSTCYYSKWEAEQNQTELLRVGVKHKYGQQAYWHNTDTLCWSTIGLTSAKDSIVYGPHYRQDNRYKSWQHGDRHDVKYYTRFKMALDNPRSENPDRPVCKIKVVYRYQIEYGDQLPDTSKHDMVFLERTLTVGDFPDSGHFDYFKFDPEWYKYPDQFWLPKDAGKLLYTPEEGIRYNDVNDDIGIQFWVDWLVDNPEESGLTLYVDNIEVYDEDWKDDFIDRDPEISANLIRNYANNYCNWSNLKYWIGHDEPYTIDAFTPIRVVDSLLYNNPLCPNKHRLLTIFNPYWTWNNLINGDTLLFQYHRMAKPEKLIVDMYPFSPTYPTPRFEDFDYLRYTFQECSILDSSFWYQAQGFGESYYDGNQWIPWIWRYPDSTELKASVMLALAHGSKGIFISTYDSWTYDGTAYGDPHIHKIQGLVDTLYGGNIPVYDLWYMIKNNLAPRLKGTLGKTLLDLNYTGDYLELRRYMGPNTAESVTENYLTLSTTPQNPTPFTYYFHAGFFESPNQWDNNHFLLSNLITYDNRWVNVGVTDNGSNYINTRFRNVEPEYGFDTTFTNEFSIDLQFPPGEGYLFQVAPVVKYGGKLIEDETISNTTTLLEEMIIQNNAALTINSTYNADRDIRINNGGILTTTGGTIKFYNGKNLIIEGAATISGTAQNKLVLDFLSPSDSNGIVIKPGGSLTISNCEIKNAGTGIFSDLNANYLNVQNVDFINCEDYSISMAGRSPGMNPTPPPQIRNCSMTNSEYGIWITLLPGMLIQDNTITNTACGIYLSNVTNAQVIDNTIISNKEEYPGIWFFSSGGAIRANLITGHTNAIHLANSSPILGSNIMTSNKIHGMYVGSGSVPYMRKGQFIGSPPNEYATSGYNKIFENGGFMGFGSDNDGSEIYFLNSNAVMDSGCNSIYDDRPVSPPLINTLLLMNGYRFGFPPLQAQYNFWGDTVYAARFGSLNVNYIPYELVPCWEPQGGGEDELILMTQFGDVIDTVYSTGDEVTGLSATELAYAEAEGYFLTGNLTNALQVYEAIINSNATEEEKYLAYQRKYSIGKLTGQSTEFFDQLSNTFSTLAANSQDSLNTKILNQLSTLSKVGEQEYETAIGEFDGIVQQNPNTEEAVYAEIDALTTALLIEESDSTLQKGRLGKYLVKTSGDYNKRVDEILRKNFGSESKETEKELLPTEYTLYQNYPNPFNPTTTIKYDLPFASEVSVVIYDVLGRKIKELVNTKQQAGKYEVQFNASNLASGVYIYQLIADNPSTSSGQGYMQSRKMILLK